MKYIWPVAVLTVGTVVGCGPARWQGVGASKPGTNATVWRACGTALRARWRAPLPGAGHAPPVLWSHRVFVAQADGPFATIICLDRATGRQLWQSGFARAVWGQLWPMPRSCPGLATDGQRLVAQFGPWTCCVDESGAEAWVQEWPEAGWTEGTEAPPVLYGDLCIVTVPWIGRVVALDKRTGTPRWQVPCPCQELAATAHPRSTAGPYPAPPFVWRDQAGRAAVLIGCGALAGYELQTGRRLWVCGDLKGQTATTLWRVGPTVVAMTGAPQAQWLAVELDPADVQARPRLLWQRPGRTAVAAAATSAQVGYVLGGDGVLEWIELGTGKTVRACRVSSADGRTGSTWSLLRVRDRLYVPTASGDIVAVRISPKCQLLATNSLREPICVALAASPGQLWLRTDRSLWCLEHD